MTNEENKKSKSDVEDEKFRMKDREKIMNERKKWKRI